MQNQPPPPPPHDSGAQGPPPAVFYKNPGLAAVLSFFWMGLGQIYNGQIAKGIAFMVFYGISWLLCFVLIGWITTPILFIYGVYDAYKSAEKVNFDLARRHSYSSNYTGGGPAPL
jgi:TM2 domain-containing membrane protein YozV